MTLGLRVDDSNDSLESRRLKVTGPAVVSLIVRTALECEDSFDDIPEEILNDLIGRLEK
jgi:hypothetical protein